ALQVWVYTSLPELDANYGNPLPNNSYPPILAYKGCKGRIFFKEAILSQTRVINFVQKDIGEMFPKWKFDAEDTPAENIIKLMFVKRPWNHWYLGQYKAGGCESSKKKDKASEEAPAEASEEVHTVARSEEIKYLSERVEAVEKKVGITTKRKGTSSQNTTSPPKPMLEPGVSNESPPNKRLTRQSPVVPADASSSKDKAPEPSLKEDARYQEKRDAALALCCAKSDRTRKLAASQQSPYTANNTAKVIIPNKKPYPDYNPFAPIDKKKLKELADWLKTCLHYRTHLDKIPRTSRTWWYHILRTSLEWLEDCKTYQTTYQKRYNANPQHFRSERMCFLDHLFAQQWRFNYKDFKDSEPDQNGLGRRLPGGTWNYYASTIPSFCQSNKRHIVVWDSICSSFAKPNGKTMRDKMAVDIFKELPDAHEFENKDNDANLGAYEGRLTVKSSGMLDDLTISSLESLLCSGLL
ncbi:unnamed protein product, partial [Brassica napus]